MENKEFVDKFNQLKKLVKYNKENYAGIKWTQKRKKKKAIEDIKAGRIVLY